MTTNTSNPIRAAATVRERRQVQSGYPASSLRFDWIFSFLSFLLLAGLLIDGWAHFHGETDNSFFTPWHFLFYSAFGFVGLFLAYHQLRNINQGYSFTRALPKGYWLSLVGTIIFAAGGVGDMIWHIVFGIEDGTEALLSPTHLLLATGMLLISTGMIRAAWSRADARGWRALGPAIVGGTLLLFILQFFTTYSHPTLYPYPADFGQNVERVLNDNIYVMNTDGSGQTRLTSSPELSDQEPSYSPDGGQIVFSRLDETDEAGANLYRMNSDSTEQTQLTTLPGDEITPIWSPDGARIAFLKEVEEVRNLYVINADGSGMTQLTDTTEAKFAPAWSPDGMQIGVSVGNGDDFHIEIIQADGSGKEVFGVSGFAATPAWSPDGQQMAYINSDNGDINISIANIDGTDVRQLTSEPGFDGFPYWSADGSQIIFTSERTGTSDIYTMPASGETEDAPAVNLTRNPGLYSYRPVFSPDGDQIVFNARALSGDDSIELDVGVAPFLLQGAFMAGVILLMLRRWALPFGAITFMLVLSTGAITLLSDTFFFLPGALVTGLIVDALVWRLKPTRNAGAYHLVGFALPTLYFALYMLTVQLIIGIGWTIHVWTGTIFLAGVAGLFLSYLITLKGAPDASSNAPSLATAA